MIIADTSVWISFFKKDNPDVFRIMNAYLRKNQVYAVSAVFGELLQGVKNRKEASLIEFFWEHLPKVKEKDLFLSAGKLSNHNKLYAKGIGFTDCYILAATVDNRFQLWTLDRKLGMAAAEAGLAPYD